MLRKVLFLVGATAVGKTEVALELAKKIPLEIISCDSMQVYKEIDIASCKPSKKMLKKVAHHLINEISVAQEYNAADFRKKVLQAIKSIHKKGRVPLIVGGSGLYMSMILDGIFKGGKKDIKFRRALEKEAVRLGKEHLYKRLKAVDPVAAAKIHPHDLKRAIRALEVFALTKKPISLLQVRRSGIWGKFDLKIFALNRPRPELYARIDERVGKMFKKGLVKEMRRCLSKQISLTASYCLGIKEIEGFLAGRYDIEEAKRLLKQNSRRYAKRQLTWFRRDERINWIEINKGESAKAVAREIILQIN